jgi:hypothetical protein
MAREIHRSNAFHAGFHDALGRVIVGFGRLEYQMKLVVKRLKGDSFTEGMLRAEVLRNMKPLCDKAKKLYAVRVADPDRRAAFAKILERSEVLWEELRNDIIHSFWTAGPDSAALMYRPKLDKRRTQVQWTRNARIPVTTLLQCADELDTLVNALDRETRDCTLTVTAKA